MLRPLPYLIAALPLLAGACGDFAGATGEEGLLRFTLVTDYELPSSDLRELTIVAGHEQRFDVDLTHDGAKAIDDPSELTYSINAGGDIEARFGNEDDPPDAYLTVEEPGAVLIEALDADGEPVDSIELDFDAADALELSVRVRSPWEEKFEEQDEGVVTTVGEGSQATFLPIPLDAAGDRLAGRIQTQATVDPEWAVVPGKSVGGVYEDGYWTLEGEIEFYFIEPGDVSVTVTDAVSGADGVHDFVVEGVDKP